jgi:hypothetical protein
MKLTDVFRGWGRGVMAVWRNGGVFGKAMWIVVVLGAVATLFVAPLMAAMGWWTPFG